MIVLWTFLTFNTSQLVSRSISEHEQKQTCEGSLIVFECLETRMKHDARAFEMAS